MLPDNCFINFLYKLGWIEFRLRRHGKRFQFCTSPELSLSTVGYNHVTFFFEVVCAPVRETCLR